MALRPPFGDGLRSFEYDDANRLSAAKVFKDGEEARIRSLHNALGQRVFKGEPEASQTLPSGTKLVDFREVEINRSAQAQMGVLLLDKITN